MLPDSSWRALLASALRPATRRRAARVSLVVGSLLVLINHWEALFGDATLNLFKVALTYMVPWGVVTWTSVMRDRELAALGTPSGLDTQRVSE